MSEIRICRVCLSTGTKMYRIDRFQLKAYYEEVMALKVNDSDNLPQYFCFECAMILHKFHKFKEKCYSGQKIFKELLWRGPVTHDSISAIDRNAKNIQSILQIITKSNRIKCYNYIGDDPPDYGKVDNAVKAENLNTVEVEYIGDSSFCDQDNSDGFIENDPIPDSLDEINTKDSTHQTVTVNIKNLLKKETGKVEKGDPLMRHNSVTNRRTRFLNASNWKKYTLKEDEAIKEFKARSENTKYLRAAHKCTDCYKGFSKEEMLFRHVQLRHSESRGIYCCRFCKMRFKWDSHLRLHMGQHFTKYQCLLCQFVCPLVNSAILHEECHSGVTRKCIHCEEEFRHASTYYTHLRTAHRSEHVCVVCGVSFVSETGLHQHKKVKHPTINLESPDDDEDVDTFCAKCDIRFETRKAYEEHLFHSVLHAEGVEHEIEDEVTIPRKVLGKRRRAKITKELRKRKQIGNEFSVEETKRRKRSKRKAKKPTTCHQCGQHFDTQSACMKHHIIAHPRTSFYPPNARHICEICGASLAPGSVAVHKNMHSREKVFSCDVCSKQFHSTVGLRRHMVTHTGEKRYACSLCDKRFTQSNSMKLHYRTFHLKQPYPKRDRRKKKETPTTEVESSSEEEEERSELDSPPPIQPEQLDTKTMMMEPHNDETVHYLELP